MKFSFLTLIMLISTLFSWLGLSSCSIGIGPKSKLSLRERLEHSPSLSVLLVGNSYSFGLVRGLKKNARVQSESCQIGHAVHSGWSLQRHRQHDATLNKIRSKKWDVVIFQEHSLGGAVSAWHSNHATLPALRELVSVARAQNANVALYQTWGRRDGQPDVKDDNFFKMNARVRKSYQRWARQVGAELIPVGDVWEQHYSTELYVEDGSHPSELGNALITRVVSESLFWK